MRGRLLRQLVLVGLKIKDQDRAGRTATAYRQNGQMVGCIKALVVLSQVQAVAGQPTYCLSPYEWYALHFLAAHRALVC